MNTSQEIDKVIETLNSAQAGFRSLIKNKKANYGKYADLSAVMDSISVALNVNGLCISQSPFFKEGRLIVVTRLFHKSGQWIENEVSLKPGQDTAQGIGGVITYGRRYGLTALLGICADDDDDGQSAQPQASQKGYESKRQEVTPEEQMKPKEAPQRNIGSEVYNKEDNAHVDLIKKWATALQLDHEDLRTLAQQFPEKTLKEIYALMNVWSKG